MRYHELTTADWRALASGLGGPAVVRELVASRLSRHLLLFKHLAEEWLDDDDQVATAVTVLSTVQREAPTVFAELMGDPLAGAWLAASVRRLQEPGTEECLRCADRLHLGALAATAALRHGLDCTLTGYAHGGHLTLPGLGDVVLGGDTAGPITIAVSRGRATVLTDAGTTTVPGEGPGWSPLRRLTAQYRGLGCAVRIEDGNPYRGTYHAPPSERLSDKDVDSWQELFTGAWELTCRYLPERAAELAVGLRVLVPLVDDGDGAARSGTARDSVGALGLTRPRTPEDLAITMIHEYQHSKLTAAIDLRPLHVRDGAERHFAPWRTDARSTAGLFQGVYAFLGVAEAWRGLCRAGHLEQVALHQFAMVREQVQAGLVALERSAELTPEGRYFVAGLRGAVDRLLDVPVPPPVLVSARSEMGRLRDAWQRRHPELG